MTPEAISDVENHIEHRVPTNAEILHAVERLAAQVHGISSELAGHLEDEQEMRPKLIELLTVFERSRGALWFFRMLIYVGAPLGALLIWAKDHVK